MSIRVERTDDNEWAVFGLNWDDVLDLADSNLVPDVRDAARQEVESRSGHHDNQGRA